MFFRKCIRKIRRIFIKIIKLKEFSYKKKCKNICNNIVNNKSWDSLKNVDESADFVISLATIPSRFDKVIYTLTSIFSQEIMPSKVYLCVSDKFTDNDFPQDVLNLKTKGLEILYCKDNVTKPHTKYFYTAQKVKDKRILTLDDDLYYDFKTTSRLILKSKESPNSIVCNRCHNVTYKKGKLLPYNMWVDRILIHKNNNLFISGVGGVLYPIDFFDESMLNLDNVSHCLYADDVYLTVMARIKKYNIVKTRIINVEQIIVDNTQEVALMKSNVGLSRNDEMIKSILNYLNVDESIFKD